MSNNVRCECGLRLRRQGTTAGATTVNCPRCTALDGELLPRGAREVLSEMRALSGMVTWDSLGDLPLCRRQLHRCMAALIAAGRVRRIECVQASSAPDESENAARFMLVSP